MKASTLVFLISILVSTKTQSMGLEKLWTESPVELCDILEQYTSLTEFETILQAIHEIVGKTMREQENLGHTCGYHFHKRFITDGLERQRYFVDRPNILIRGCGHLTISVDPLGTMQIYTSKIIEVYRGLKRKLNAKMVAKLESWIPENVRKERQLIRSSELANIKEQIQSVVPELQESMRKTANYFEEIKRHSS
ncbi:hypothetical protein ACFLY6_02190 [Candidatus Dependentiae bacterium]